MSKQSSINQGISSWCIIFDLGISAWFPVRRYRSTKATMVLLSPSPQKWYVQICRVLWPMNVHWVLWNSHLDKTTLRFLSIRIRKVCSFCIFLPYMQMWAVSSSNFLVYPCLKSINKVRTFLKSSTKYKLQRNSLNKSGMIQ